MCITHTMCTHASQYIAHYTDTHTHTACIHILLTMYMHIHPYLRLGTPQRIFPSLKGTLCSSALGTFCRQGGSLCGSNVTLHMATFLGFLASAPWCWALERQRDFKFLNEDCDQDNDELLIHHFHLPLLISWYWPSHLDLETFFFLWEYVQNGVLHHLHLFVYRGELYHVHHFCNLAPCSMPESTSEGLASFPAVGLFVASLVLLTKASTLQCCDNHKGQ